MNSTTWSYVAIIGALCNLVAALVNSAIGVNPRPELALVLLFVVIGAAASGWQTYRWRRPARKWQVYSDSAHWYQLEGANFPDAISRFLEIRDAKIVRFVQINAPDGSGFCWNNPDYLDLREFGGGVGPKFGTGAGWPAPDIAPAQHPDSAPGGK